MIKPLIHLISAWRHGGRSHKYCSYTAFTNELAKVFALLITLCIKQSLNFWTFFILNTGVWEHAWSTLYGELCLFNLKLVSVEANSSAPVNRVLSIISSLPVWRSEFFLARIANRWNSFTLRLLNPRLVLKCCATAKTSSTQRGVESIG